MSLRPAACVAVALIALVSACGSGPAAAPRSTALPTPASSTAPTPAPSVKAPLGRYVAIGDSYTAGPGIDPIDPGSGLCQRSALNFPSLLAEQLNKSVVDVSCSGATTSAATQGATGLGGTLDPQVDALTKDTDLVTVEIGGNDGGLFATLLQSCSQGAVACRQYVQGQAPAVLTTTTDSVVRTLRAVSNRAPKATVVLVGYLRLSPAQGTCPALGIDAQAQDTVRAAETALDDALQAAAGRADVPFVSMREASVGHDACAGAKAWTNGATTDGDGIVFHPRPAGMRAVADQVARVVQ